MNRTAVLTLAALLGLPAVAWSQMMGNPMEQVAKRNLFVGIEYSTLIHVYDLDTEGIDTTTDIAGLKVTTGITDWLDVFVRAGGARLTLDYEQLGWTDNFESDYSAGFGGGGRLRLFNFVNAETQVFLQGDGFVFRASDTFERERPDGSTQVRDREVTWSNLSLGLGLTKRWDYVDITVGATLTEVWWELNDVEITRFGSATGRVPLDTRDSFETNSPLAGFIGLDCVLPYEYRLSLQGGITDMDNLRFGAAISQGLEKD